jgi:hypothetical protein
MDRAAAELFGVASGALDAATAELKLLVGVGLGVGHCPAIVYRPEPYPTGSTPANGILPKLAFAIATVAIGNCIRPSTGTEIFIVLSFSPTRKRGESGRGVNRSIP